MLNALKILNLDLPFMWLSHCGKLHVLFANFASGYWMDLVFILANISYLSFTSRHSFRPVLCPRGRKWSRTLRDTIRQVTVSYKSEQEEPSSFQIQLLILLLGLTSECRQSNSESLQKSRVVSQTCLNSFSLIQALFSP